MMLVALVQIPLLCAAFHLQMWPGWLTAFGVAVSLPVMLQLLHSPWDHKPRSRLHKYAVMWPFYIWWTFCLLFSVSAALLLTVAALSPLRTTHALWASFALSAIASYRALRPRPRVVHTRLPLQRLPRAFEGLRIVQLTDIHCGPFTPASRVRRWVARANALAPDIIVITGDLITSGPDYIEEMAAALSDLEAPEGVYACLGNHDHFGTGGRVGPALRKHGITVLDNTDVLLRRTGGHIYLAGVDDNWSGRDDLKRALRERPHGATTLLLAHDPGLFPRAVASRVDLTISGHTHGGQFAVPWMVRTFNLARLMTPYSSGLYREGNSFLYVSHGLGTSGPPIRLGARPELSLLTLELLQPQEVEVRVSAKPRQRVVSQPEAGALA